jgi:thiol-disulfide isomerase/thioredoxin
MIRLTNTNLALIGVIVVLGLGLLYIYTSKTKENMIGVPSAGSGPPKETPPVGSGPSVAPSPGLSPEMAKQPCLVMFHAEWCGHCKHLAPEWEKVKQAVGDKHLIVDIESKNPLMKNFTLKGFPTIRYFPDGLGNTNKFDEYQGDRTAETILQFLSAQVSK